MTPEEQAREMLAAEYEAAGLTHRARRLRDHTEVPSEAPSLRALTKVLQSAALSDAGEGTIATPEIEALCARLEAFEGSDALGNGDFRLMSEAAAKLREMAEALEPFAREADTWSPERNDGDIFDDNERVDFVDHIRVGDLRRARAALAGGSHG